MLYGKADKRRTMIAAPDAKKEYSEEELIVAEDNHVLTRDGWVKRQKEIKDPSTTRLREGDQVFAGSAGSTRATVDSSRISAPRTPRESPMFPRRRATASPFRNYSRCGTTKRSLRNPRWDTRLTGSLAERERKTGERYGLAATTDGFAWPSAFRPFSNRVRVPAGALPS